MIQWRLQIINLGSENSIKQLNRYTVLHIILAGNWKIKNITQKYSSTLNRLSIRQDILDYYKLKKILSRQYYLIMHSYLNNRQFKIRFLYATTAVFPTEAGVPQDSILGPILYFIYTTDLLTSANVNRATIRWRYCSLSSGWKTPK